MPSSIGYRSTKAMRSRMRCSVSINTINLKMHRMNVCQTINQQQEGHGHSTALPGDTTISRGFAESACPMRLPSALESWSRRRAHTAP
mmetsp:Transcript_9241/g.27046  ORF Transcript_9241/g.27046 Transcript_9241/m.27046 type:complete len:88 (-) Transcript_9241:281-544(-)